MNLPLTKEYVCGHMWTIARSYDNKYEYYLMSSSLTRSHFNRRNGSNDYELSDVYDELSHSVLLTKLMREFGNRLAYEEIELSSPYGTTNHGYIHEKLFVPSLNMYRRYFRKIDSYYGEFWTCTPANISDSESGSEDTVITIRNGYSNSRNAKDFCCDIRPCFKVEKE